MAIYITGDIHGNPTRFSTKNFPEQKDMTKDDIVIILGDFGLIWNQTETKDEKYWLNWLERKPFSTVFIDGNHENFDRLKTYTVETWNGGKVHKIRPHIMHLMRGQIFTIDNKKFFTFGGASSHDVQDGILEPDDPDFQKKRKALKRKPNTMYRIHHISWWPEELPTESEITEGKKNLKKENHTVNYILTHSPYTSILKQIDGGAGFYQSDRLSDYLQTIHQTTNYNQWLFGHMHIDADFHRKHAIAIHKRITRLV